MNKYKFHWLDGSTTVTEGTDGADAFTRMGYGASALRAVDYYEEVTEPDPNGFMKAVLGAIMGQSCRDATHAVCGDANSIGLGAGVLAWTLNEKDAKFAQSAFAEYGVSTKIEEV